MIFADHKIQPKSKNPPNLYQIHPRKKHKKNSVPFPIFLPKKSLVFSTVFRNFPELTRLSHVSPPLFWPVGGSPQTTPVMLQSIDASAQGNDIGHDLFFSRTSVWDLSGNFFSGWWFHNKWLAINLDEPNLYIRNGCSMIYLPSVFNPVEKY